MGGYNWMKVVDVMTKKSFGHDTCETIGQADELMAENKIRQLPVVDGAALLGIITDRDIRSFLAGPSLLDLEERAKALKTGVET